MLTAEQFASEFTDGFNIVRRTLVRMGASSEDAEDCAQEAWTRAWAERESFRGDCRPMSWVMSIARNLFLDRLRRLRVRPWFSKSKIDLSDVMLTVPGPSHLARLEDRIDIDRGMDQISPKLSVMLRDYYFMGYTKPELSARHGRPEGTVGVRLMRGKRELRKRMAA